MTIPENTKYLPLSQDKFAIIDTNDYDWLSQWKWSYYKTKNGGYACRNVWGNVSKGERVQTLIIMHRIIMSAPKGMQVDHINSNRLDNRRCNLRICTSSQNAHHRPKVKGHLTSSKYKGVSRHAQTGKWWARIAINNMRISLGLFDNEIDAAKAYDAAAIKYHGDFAIINDAVY